LLCAALFGRRRVVVAAMDKGQRFQGFFVGVRKWFRWRENCFVDCFASPAMTMKPPNKMPGNASCGAGHCRNQDVPGLERAKYDGTDKNKRSIRSNGVEFSGYVHEPSEMLQLTTLPVSPDHEPVPRG